MVCIKVYIFSKKLPLVLSKSKKLSKDPGMLSLWKRRLSGDMVLAAVRKRLYLSYVVKGKRNRCVNGMFRKADFGSL